VASRRYSEVVPALMASASVSFPFGETGAAAVWRHSYTAGKDSDFPLELA